MEVRAIIEKLKKGEQLTAEEQKALAEFDYDKTLNGAQAEARRKAESQLEAERKQREQLAAQLAELEKASKAKDEEKLSATERLQATLKELQGKFEAAEKRSAELAAQQAKAQRAAKIRSIAEKSGVQFVDGFDHSIAFGALESALQSVQTDQLDDDQLVKPVLGSFVAANKAVIRDLSGGGSGTPPKGGSTQGSGGTWTREQIKTMKPEDFAKNRDAILQAQAEGKIK